MALDMILFLAFVKCVNALISSSLVDCVGSGKCCAADAPTLPFLCEVKVHFLWQNQSVSDCQPVESVIFTDSVRFIFVVICHVDHLILLNSETNNIQQPKAESLV